MAGLLVGTEEGLVELAADGTAARIHLPGRNVQAVSGDGSGWWALVDGAEVWHAGVDGSGWQRDATAAEGTALTCLLPGPGGLLVGTAGAHLLRLDGGGHLATLDGFDHVAGRASWYTPWGGPPDTRSLAGAAGALFANVHVGGIVASTDEGRSWYQTSLDIHADVHQVLVTPEQSDRLLAACADGLAVSDDRGSSWRVEHDGLHATYARALAVAGDTVVMSASSGPRGERSALYRRPLAGHGPFERCRDGLPEWFGDNIDTGCLVAQGATVAAATPGGAIFVSTDAGHHFAELDAGASALSCIVLL